MEVVLHVYIFENCDIVGYNLVNLDCLAPG